MLRALVTACALSTALGCAAAREPAREVAREPGPPCVPHGVVLLRHAEKAVTESADRDPALSPGGHERAARIGKLLARASASRLVASEYRRTQQTLAPLAERAGKTVEVVPAAHTAELVRELRSAPAGSLTVVASHSNVIPQLVRELGGGPLRDVSPDGNLPEDDYARVLVMSVGCSASSPVLELGSD